ncbi:MAG: DUF1501 domain-containing protein, partial [Dongiaceae bacterium]
MTDTTTCICPSEASQMDRRAFLKNVGFCAGGIAAAMAAGPQMAFAGPVMNKKLIYIFLRGGADNFNILPPYADANYVAARGDIAVRPPNFADASKRALDINGYFGMHPAMQALYNVWNNPATRNELTIFNAVGNAPYDLRSHFDGEAYMLRGDGVPSGAGQPVGWINRLLTVLTDEAQPGAVAMTGFPDMPLVFNGPEPTLTWLPPAAATPSETDFMNRLVQMYGGENHLQALVQSAYNSRVQSRTMIADHPQIANGVNRFSEFFGDDIRAELMALVMGMQNGPSIGYFEMGGWDMHAGAHSGGMSYYWSYPAWRIQHFAEAVAILRQRLIAQGQWQDTMIVVQSEFGRQLRPNGPVTAGNISGTDHGWGGCAFVLTGNSALHGWNIQQSGQMRGMVGNWPGLGSNVIN